MKRAGYFNGKMTSYMSKDQRKFDFSCQTPLNKLASQLANQLANQLVTVHKIAWIDYGCSGEEILYSYKYFLSFSLCWNPLLMVSDHQDAFSLTYFM